MLKSSNNSLDQLKHIKLRLTSTTLPDIQTIFEKLDPAKEETQKKLDISLYNQNFINLTV